MILTELAAAAAESRHYLHWTDLGLNPVIFHIGFFSLKWYSLAYIAGIIVGWWYLLKLIDQPGAPMARSHADDLVFYVTLGVILGGRLGYVIFYAPEMFLHPLQVFKLWDGGMSFHGGVIGTSIGLILLARRHVLNWLRIHDYVACCVPFGLFFGRLANFVNGELWGKPTDVPWAIVFPHTVISGIEPPRHPSELYEAVLEGICLFLILWFAFWKTKSRYDPGKMTGIFLVGYGAFRFVVEFFREPDSQFAGTFFANTIHMGQVLCIPMILGGLWLIVTAKGRRQRIEPIAGAKASPEVIEAEGALPDRLARAITLAGPIGLAQFMAAANAQYYATRDPFGAAGDFVTAPEISQMFGELIGLALADTWDRAGRPHAAYVELGPGRGTLAADALRAMAKARLMPPAHLVETSPVLRAAQAERLPGATWHDDLTDLPNDGALLIVANEFFDALPIRQLIKGDGWRERLVACQDTMFVPIAGKPIPDAVIPPHVRDAAPGAVLETSPAAVATMRALARRLVAQGGVAIVVDYGYEGPAIGDTLQAVRGHTPANPFADPGEQDLTAHVDFATLKAAAAAEGASVHGPVDQGDLLLALGIDSRAAALARSAPARADELVAARQRLVAPDRMGRLFKAIAVTAPSWPPAAGFA